MAEGVETKLLTSLEVKQVDTEKREIEGYAATFGNLDLNGDVIHKGAFDRTLKEKKPSDIAVFVGHNSAMLPVGIPVEMRTDDKGLWTKTRIFKTQAGDDLLQTARELHEAGQPLGMSIGFQTRDSKWQKDGQKAYRLLTDADLMEYSYAAKQVIASPPALVTAVKTKQRGAGMANEHFLPGEEPVWTTAYIQNLPDSAFAYVEEGVGGEQVEGKTLPHTMRHFPHHNDDGSVNRDAVRREYDRAKTSDSVRLLSSLAGARDEAIRHLRDHARAEGLIGDGAKLATDAITEISATLADLSLESSEVARALTVSARLGVDQKVGVRLKGTMRAKLRSIKAALDELLKWAEKAERGEEDDEDDEEEKAKADDEERARWSSRDVRRAEEERRAKTRTPARRALKWAENASLIAWDAKAAKANGNGAADGELSLDDLHNAIDHLENALDMLENADRADGLSDEEDEDEEKQSPFEAPGRRRRIDEGEVDAGGRDRGSRKKWDPDGDGDDDSTPGGDTDHDWWTADGRQKRPIPPGAKGSKGKKRGKAAIVGGAEDVADELQQAHADILSHHDAIHGDHKIGRKTTGEAKQWTSQYVNDLPDSAFAMVYTNDAGEKVRKLPHHDSTGKLDLPHLRNALSRHPQMVGDPQDEVDKAERHLERHAQDEEIGGRGGDNEESMRKMRNGNGKEKGSVSYVVALKDMEATLARYQANEP
jgi:HK97 family phage prohead protease